MQVANYVNMLGLSQSLINCKPESHYSRHQIIMLSIAVVSKCVILLFRLFFTIHRNRAIMTILNAQVVETCVTSKLNSAFVFGLNILAQNLTVLFRNLMTVGLGLNSSSTPSSIMFLIVCERWCCFTLPTLTELSESQNVHNDLHINLICTCSNHLCNGYWESKLLI